MPSEVQPPSTADDANARQGRPGRGDSESIEHLLARHLPGVRAYLRRNAGPGVLGRESAADLAQSVAREALEHLADQRLELRSEAEFKQWLYQAALLKVRSRRRYWGADKRARPQSEGAAKAQAADLEEFFRTSATPSRHAEINEQVAAMSEAYAELPDGQQRIIELARVQGLSHRDIAQQLGITEGNSRMQLSRALARLASGAHQRLGEPPGD